MEEPFVSKPLCENSSILSLLTHFQALVLTLTSWSFSLHATTVLRTEGETHPTGGLWEETWLNCTCHIPTWNDSFPKEQTPFPTTPLQPRRESKLKCTTLCFPSELLAPFTPRPLEIIWHIHPCPHFYGITCGWLQVLQAVVRLIIFNVYGKLRNKKKKTWKRRNNFPTHTAHRTPTIPCITSPTFGIWLVFQYSASYLCFINGLSNVYFIHLSL